MCLAWCFQTRQHWTSAQLNTATVRPADWGYCACLQNYTASYPRLSWFWDSDISWHCTIMYCKMVCVAVNRARLTAKACGRFESRGKWRCVIGCVVPGVCKNCNAFIFRVKPSQTNSHSGGLTVLHRCKCWGWCSGGLVGKDWECKLECRVKQNALLMKQFTLMKGNNN